jgi:hypothetical protein
VSDEKLAHRPETTDRAQFGLAAALALVGICH